MARVTRLLAVASLGVATMVGALLLAVTAAALGPAESVVCDTGHLPNRIAQRITQGLGAGHIDAANANYCIVPSTMAWLLAVGTFVLVPTVVLLVGLHHRTAAR